MQKLTIRNFGPIKDVELEVNDILIFIGAQATGKSTISKCIYFFRSLRDNMIADISELVEIGRKMDASEWEFSIFAKFVEFFFLTESIENSFIRYEYSEGVWIELGGQKATSYADFVNISPDLAQKYNRIMDSVQKFAMEIREWNYGSFPSLSSSDIANIDARRANFTREYIQLTENLFGEKRDLIFIPATRSTLSNTFTVKNNPNVSRTLDLFMGQFARRIETIRPLFRRSFDEVIADQIYKKNGNHSSTDSSLARLNMAKTIIGIILKARFEFSDESQDILKALDDTKPWSIPVNLASSGQQEALWILLLLFVLLRNGKDAFVAIEEAEAHLYPEAQKDIVELIALLANAGENQIVMTTHSPYILAAWNNLIYAYQVGQARPDETTKIVDEMLWIRPERVSAYLVEDGTIKSIIDEETSMIEMDAIDRVSRTFIEVFDQLLDLEVDNEKEVA